MSADRRFMSFEKLRGRLEQEDAAIFQLAEKMEEVRDRILHGTAVTILHVAPRENLEWMRNCAGRILGNLRGEQMPDHENKTENRGENAGYTFPVPARRGGGNCGELQPVYRLFGRAERCRWIFRADSSVCKCAG